MDMVLIVRKDLKMLEGMLPSQNCQAGFFSFHLLYLFGRDAANTELPRVIVVVFCIILIYFLYLFFLEGMLATELQRGIVFVFLYFIYIIFFFLEGVLATQSCHAGVALYKKARIKYAGLIRVIMCACVCVCV
jgi:hypothetical protein